MVRPGRFELPTPWFEAKYSIQLSYRRINDIIFFFFFLKKGALRSNYAEYKSFFDKDFNPQTHGSDLDLTPWKEKFSTNQFV
jgi:predicted metal-dependent hydrolase